MISSVIKFRLAFLVLLLCSLTACNSKSKQSAALRTIILPNGQSISINTDYPKVMGLSPASTEMLFAIVPDSQILAVSHVCNYPPAALKKSKITTYPFDIESIIKLKPDFVFTETGMISPDLLARLKDFGIQNIVLDYTTLDDVPKNIRLIGKIANSEIAAQALSDTLTSQIANLKKINYPHRPTVLTITWAEPIIAYGLNTLMSEKILLAGGINAIQDLKNRPFPELSREYILKLNPDVILGGTFQKMDSTFFSKYPELKQITAYKKQQIYPLTDDIATRPSPRIIESILEIKEALGRAR